MGSVSNKGVVPTQGERSVDDLESRLRETMYSLPETLVEVDMTGRLTYVNRAALEAFGLDPEDRWQEKTVFDVLAVEHCEPAAQNIADIVEGREPRWTEYTAKRKDGSVFPVMIRSYLVKRNGEPVGLRSVVVDITERKEMERELVQTNTRLAEALRELQNAQQLVIQQERLSALGQMAAGIAHDLNNALMPILANCEMLLRNPRLLADRNRAEHLLN